MFLVKLYFYNTYFGFGTLAKLMSRVYKLFRSIKVNCSHNCSFIAELNIINHPLLRLAAVFCFHSPTGLSETGSKCTSNVKQMEFFGTCLSTNIDTHRPTNEPLSLFFLELFLVPGFGCVRVMVISSNKNPTHSILTPPAIKIPVVLTLLAPGFFFYTPFAIVGELVYGRRGGGDGDCKREEKREYLNRN